MPENLLTDNLLIDTANKSAEVVKDVTLGGLKIADTGIKAIDNAVSLRSLGGVLTKHLPEHKILDTSYGDIRSAGVEKVREWNPVAGVAADILAPNVVDLAFGAGKIVKGAKAIKHGISLTPDVLKIVRNSVDDLISPKLVTAGGPALPSRLAISTAEQFTKANPLMIKGTKLDAVPAGLLKGAARRGAQASALSPGVATSAYKKGSLYPGSKRGTWLTNRHHVGGLDRQGSLVSEHKSFDVLPKGEKSPLIKHVENKYGIKSGNYEENLVDMLEYQGGLKRNAQVQEIVKQLDNKIHGDTINDLLGGSKITLPEYKKADYAFISDWAKRFPGEKLPWNPDNPGKFATIDIKDSTGKLIEQWIPKNVDEYNDRFNIVLKKAGIDSKNLNRKAIKVDPKLEIFGVDHQDTHRILLEAEKIKGNPIYEAIKSIESGKYKNLSIEEAGKIYAKAHFYQENVAANILKYRYNKIKEVFSEIENLPANLFDDLSAAQKQKFFSENVNAIAAKGGLEKRLNLKQASEEIKGWTQSMTDVFGWSPTGLIKKGGYTPRQMLDKGSFSKKSLTKKLSIGGKK